MVLQCLCHLHRSTAIGICLNHAYELGLGLHIRAVVVEIVYHCLEVHLKDGFMHLLLQEFADAVETEGARSLYEYHLIAECSEDGTLDEGLTVGEEVFLSPPDSVCLCHEVGTHTDEFLHSPLDA